MSTVDFQTAAGSQIPIEERSPDEIARIGDRATAPAGVDAFNPAFDVTPADLITAIITEKGVARPPYGQSLAKLAKA
jgi:methylthioribose-1-phosphate isomerase